MYLMLVSGVPQPSILALAASVIADECGYNMETYLETCAQMEMLSEVDSVPARHATMRVKAPLKIRDQ